MIKAVLLILVAFAIVTPFVKPTETENGNITVNFFLGPECRDKHNSTTITEGECYITSFKDFSWYSTYAVNGTNVIKSDWEGPNCVDHVTGQQSIPMNACIKAFGQNTMWESS